MEHLCCGQVADGKVAGAGGGEQKEGTKAVLWRMWGRLVVIMEGAWRVFKTPSFLLILLGNIIGTIVGLSMGYKILYFQVRIPSLNSPIPCSLAPTSF